MAEPSNMFDTADWFAASPEDQALVAEDHFNKVVGNTAAFRNADAAGQADLRLAHKMLLEESTLKSPHNPTIRKAQEAQAKVDGQGFLENIKDTIVRSHQEAISLLPLGNDAIRMDGTMDPGAYGQAVKYLQKRAAAPQTLERKQIDVDMASWRNSHDHSDLAGKFKAGLKLASDFVTNPTGVAQLAAESTSSITAGWVGGKTGALAGTGVAAAAAAATGGAAAPIAAVTVPVGAMAGSVASLSGQAATQKYLDNLGKAMTERKIPLTEANMKQFVETNPELVKELQTSAVKYGAGMGLVDRLLGGVGGRLATAPERAASRVARASAKGAPGRAAISEIAQTTGKSVDEATELYVNSQARATMAEQTFKSKIGRKAANYGVQVASEPVSEAAGMVAAGEEIKAEDLILETVGGIGAGPYAAAVDKSLFGTKLAKEQTTNFAKKILAGTPESRAVAEVQKQELKTAKAQNNAPADFNHDKEVAATEISDPKVAEWADPKHASYNPVKAVKVLAKEENPDADHVDRTRQVYLDYRDSVMESMDRWEAEMNEAKTFADKGEVGKAAIAQKAADTTAQIIETKQKTLKQIADQVNNVKARAELSAKARTVKPIDPETATPDELTEHITESLGSYDSERTITNDGVAAALKRKDISDEQRTMLVAVTEANTARKSINDRAASGKSMDQVSNDIYSGIANSDFKGIDAYRQGIMYHLTGERIPEATKQLDGLKKFRDAHQAKSELATELFGMVKKNLPFTPDQQARYKAQQRLNPNFRIDRSSVNYVANVAQEAQALSAEVTLAESLMAVHKSKGQRVAPPVTSSTSTASPAAPVATVKELPESAPVSQAKADLDIDYTEISDVGLQRYVDKAMAAGVANLTTEQAGKLEAVNKEIERRKTGNGESKAAKPENAASEKDVDQGVDSADVINESTAEKISASLVSDISLNELEVTYTDTDGSEITKSYAKAAQDLDTEIQEAEAILKCFGAK